MIAVVLTAHLWPGRGAAAPELEPCYVTSVPTLAVEWTAIGEKACCYRRERVTFTHDLDEPVPQDEMTKIEVEEEDAPPVPGGVGFRLQRQRFALRRAFSPPR